MAFVASADLRQTLAGGTALRQGEAAIGWLHYAEG
jgi:hypothetical protein